MNEVILSNMLGCQTYCISDSPSNRYWVARTTVTSTTVAGFGR